MVLPSSSGSLVVTIDETGINQWCQVQLDVLGVRRALGAEGLQYMARHLTWFLADSSAGIRWVLTLSEMHTSMYGEHVTDGAIIHLQNAAGEMFAKLVLTTVEKEHWLAVCESLKL